MRKRDRAEKRDALRSRYGGLMTLADLARELGFRNPVGAQKWACEVGIPTIRINGRRKFDTDSVAMALIDCRE